MKDHQGDSTKEAWILCLILGVIFINFPFVHIFDNDRLIFGIPPLVLYFFIGWPASIGVTWLFVKQINKESAANDEERME
ncbi:hypothetical protein [Malonomonas rubra]|uniref:hypothetical protein n=1 Tax=Malonomonas rubra TaxID=57040 RepID=UPI0026F10A97|nr:hypothetical protein [Malonomonas rubra]